jgi:antitoxin component of MazEF toxin-antitoxin module
MATAHIKKIIRIGGSLAIILPSQWAKGKVKAGEEMVVVGNGELRIFPVHAKGGQAEDGRKDAKNR